jgi:hypothetical protein
VLQLLKNNNPFTVIILLIFTLVVKMQALLHPQVPLSLPDNFVYNAILHLLSPVFGANAFAYTLLAVALIFIQALYINRITIKHKLFNRPSYVPAYTYIMLTSVYAPLSYFSLALLVSWCVLPGVDMLLSFSQTFQPRKLIYNAGFVLCIAALLQCSALGYLVLFLLCLVMLRPFNAGEWAVAIMGYVTPFYFFAALLFLTDTIGLLPQWVHIGISLPHTISSPLYVVGMLSGFIILFASGLYTMQLQLPRMGIYIRRNWLGLIFYLIISVFVAVCTDREVQGAWLIAIPALSLIISYALSLEKSKGFSNFIFYFSLIFIAFCQLTINK